MYVSIFSIFRQGPIIFLCAIVSSSTSVLDDNSLSNPFRMKVRRALRRAAVAPHDFVETDTALPHDSCCLESYQLELSFSYLNQQDTGCQDDCAHHPYHRNQIGNILAYYKNLSMVYWL